jgi:hypothetical protein
MTGKFPSCQAPSKKVQVGEKLTGFIVSGIIVIHGSRVRRRRRSWRYYCPNSIKDFLAGRAGDSHGYWIDRPQWTPTAPTCARQLIKILINSLRFIRVISSMFARIIARLTARL